MTRRLLPLAAVALCLLAQSNRESYEELYKAWRTADPNLELDAAAGQADDLAKRAATESGLASAYGSAHAAGLSSTAGQQLQNLNWLGANPVQPLPDLAPAPAEVRFVDREAVAVGASVRTFANDPDRAIQQLRQAFQREQAALDRLKTSIVDRQQAEDKAVKSVAATEQARAKAVQEYTLLSTALSQSSGAMNQEITAWANYYSKLADAARTAPPAVSNAPAAPGGSPAASTSAAPPAPSITPVPLARYVGVWSYMPGMAYFGSQPEVVDFVLHEEDGHATGTFYARFKLPPGNAGDPVLRFEFSGDFKATLNQSFKLTTTDGAAGTVDINPGIAFNELEVNFTTGATPGKVRQGDMLLLKR